MLVITALAVTVLVSLYYYFTRNFNYWKERGIKYEKPVPILGSTASNYLLKQSITQYLADIYRKYPEEKVVGIFRSSRPELVLRDPEIIKRVLTTDFTYFYGRGLNLHDYVEPLLRNLFFADGDLWRLLRQRMTPAFTSGKLRAMFPLVVERAARLQERALAAAAAGRTVDARDLMARYTTDFIGACGFGLQADSLNEENSEFRKLGARIFDISFKDIVVIYLKDFFPEIFSRLKSLGRVESDLGNLVRKILIQRNYKPSGRHDFIDLLLECKSKGTIVGESIEKTKEDGTPETSTLELDDMLMTAQVFVFFAAGFETSSSATSYTLHQLAYNQDVQKKVQDEIDGVLAKHDNELSYDAIKEMTYLDLTFKEGMRMFPSLGFLIRRCSKRYTFEELGLSIDRGVRVFIPLQALHNDPNYFESPDRFRPERFDPEVFDSSLKNIYMPFGVGPRACIGERLGLMQSLAGLAAILSRFTVHPAPESQRSPRVNPASGIVQSVTNGIPLLFKERKITT